MFGPANPCTPANLSRRPIRFDLPVTDNSDFFITSGSGDEFPVDFGACGACGGGEACPPFDVHVAGSRLGLDTLGLGPNNILTPRLR